MDRTAIYFVLVTIGLMVVLSALVIIPRRAIRKFRGSPTDATVSVRDAVPILALAIGLLICATFIPWLGLVLFAILLATCGTQLYLMPGQQDGDVEAVVARQGKSPIYRAYGFALALMIGMLAVVLLLEIFG